MASPTRTNLMALKEEVTEGVLIDITAGSEFVPLREGFSFAGEVETLDTDELVAGDIGASKSFISKEVPAASFAKYLKHSGVEGQAPEYSILLKAALGAQTDNAVEFSVTAGSSAGTSAVRASLKMAGDDEDNFSVGQAVLIKDSVNGFNIRNVFNVDSAGDQLDLNFNLLVAPASGVALGKAIFFEPGTAHPTFSAHNWQAQTNSAFYQAMAGCRPGSIVMDFPAIDFATATFDFAGIEFFFNPIRVTTGVNDKLDFTDDGGIIVATLSEKVYKTPIELASEIQTKMQAAADASGGDNIFCIYDSATGKFTISTTTGTLLSLLWDTGGNTATSIRDEIGYDNTDDTGALTYTSDSAVSLDPTQTASFDTEDNIVIKNAELLIGGFADIGCLKASNASVTIGTPKTDVPSVCATTGVDSSVILTREVTFASQLILQQFQVDLFDRFINNTTTSWMFNAGPKDGSGNFQAGKSINLYSPNSSITAHPVGDQDGYQVVNLEAKCFVGANESDFYINFL